MRADRSAWAGMILAVLAVWLPLGAPGRAGAQGSPVCAGAPPTVPPPAKRAPFPRLRFGIAPAAYPRSGPYDTALLVRRMRELQGSARPPVMHVYAAYTGATSPVTKGNFPSAVAAFDALHGAGFPLEVVINYGPSDLGTAPDSIDRFVQYVRNAVRSFGPHRSVIGLQITNEANFPTPARPSPDQPAKPSNSIEALVRGVIAAKTEARRLGYGHLSVGFNWFYETSQANERRFWSEIGRLGGRPFLEALDWVGADIYVGETYPQVVAPKGEPGDLRAWMVQALSELRECYMPLAGIPDAVPIHITENGYDTDDEVPHPQAEMIEQAVQAVDEYRATYNVTDYRYFDFRDGDSPDAFQRLALGNGGLVNPDFSPKPSFATYRRLMEELGEPPTSRRARLLVGRPRGLRRAGRRRALRAPIRAKGALLRDVRVTLRTRGGRLVGRSRSFKAAEGRLIRARVSLSRTLRPGGYVLTARGRDPDGARVRGTKRLTLARKARARRRR